MNYNNDINKLSELFENIIISNNRNDLNNFFLLENIHLYYSEIKNDNRVLYYNKWIFSIWDIEYWLDWFYRTLKKLIIKCRKVKYMLFNFKGYE